jgi:hypothetical protein
VASHDFGQGDAGALVNVAGAGLPRTARNREHGTKAICGSHRDVPGCQVGLIHPLIKGKLSAWLLIFLPHSRTVDKLRVFSGDTALEPDRTLPSD